MNNGTKLPQQNYLDFKGGLVATNSLTGSKTEVTFDSLALIASTDAKYIPYIGATGDILLGANDLSVEDEIYGIAWDSSVEVPTKNSLYDKIQTISSTYDTVYLKLDTSNDPITENLDVLKAADDSKIFISTYSTNLADYSRLDIRNSYSNTAGTKATTQNNEYLGMVSFQGVNTGLDYTYGSRIYSRQNAIAGAFTLDADLTLESDNIYNVLGDTIGGHTWELKDSTSNTVASINSVGDADFGSGNIITTGSMTADTLNTGQGDNDLYDMNQNVLTTSSPTFVDVTVNTEVYGIGWNTDNTVPTKDAVYDKVETIAAGAQTPWAQSIDGAGYDLSSVDDATVDTLHYTTLDPAISLTGLVPYIGATGDVLLGSYNITASYLTGDGSLLTNLPKVDYTGSPVVFYLNDSASDIATYYELYKIPTGYTEQYDSASVNNNQTLIEAYASDSTGLGGTAITGGEWNFHTYANVSSTTGSGTSQIKIFIYNRAGTAETELFNVTTGNLPSTTITLNEIVTVQPSFTINATDRLVVKYYANTTKTTRTVGFTHNGASRYSNIHTPLIFRHNDLSGLNEGDYKHQTSDGYNRTVYDTRTISTTAPITGGGDLSANRTFALTLNGDIVATAPILINGTTAVNDIIPGADLDFTFSISDATTTTKGAASFDATDFSTSSGAVTIDDDGHTHTSLSVKQYNQTISKTIYNITNSTDFLMWQTPIAITVNKITGYCDGGTNTTIIIEECSATGTTCAGINATGWIFANVTEGEIINFSDAAIDAGDWIKWNTTSQLGNPTFFTINIDYSQQ